MYGGGGGEMGLKTWQSLFFIYLWTAVDACLDGGNELTYIISKEQNASSTNDYRKLGSFWARLNPRRMSVINPLLIRSSVFTHAKLQNR